ncbi:hypothetical protein SAMN06265348_113217 [Pedobacter westerhofensis]|uniref:Uncharacterized protein n=1 Tax=Pedobacter westerhofensis TaxID=425512 RepID=A0A521FN71_9SPHI|nr:hypothetical protein [Pedobacter westerhofensis]SMO97020.1 hypothetical protein SAMN06265348_113217 [Pedobacter westerhofensis]
MDTEGKIEDFRDWIDNVDSRLAYLIKYYEACENYEMCAILVTYQDTLLPRLVYDQILNVSDNNI